MSGGAAWYKNQIMRKLALQLFCSFKSYSYSLSFCLESFSLVHNSVQVFFYYYLLLFYSLFYLLSLSRHIPMWFSSFSSNVLFLSTVVSTFGHLSLVRTWEEAGNNRQGRLLIGPQRIRARSRERSLEECWLKTAGAGNGRAFALKRRSEASWGPREASRGSQEEYVKWCWIRESFQTNYSVLRESSVDSLYLYCRICSRWMQIVNYQHHCPFINYITLALFRLFRDILLKSQYTFSVPV